VGEEGASTHAWAEDAATRSSEILREGKRQSVRPPSTPFQIEVEISLTSESQFFADLSGDMSTLGLFVQTYRTHPVGSCVLITATLPLGEVRARGVVRWVRGATEETPPGLGIAFERLSTAERASIEAFCASRPPFYHDLEPG
jgi:uncharacterized protein (TIGR02266 family)